MPKYLYLTAFTLQGPAQAQALRREHCCTVALLTKHIRPDAIYLFVHEAETHSMCLYKQIKNITNNPTFRRQGSRCYGIKLHYRCKSVKLSQSQASLLSQLPEYAMISIRATQVVSILFTSVLNGLWHLSGLLQHQHAMLPRPFPSNITAIFICLLKLHALLSQPSDRK